LIYKDMLILSFERIRENIVTILFAYFALIVHTPILDASEDQHTRNILPCLILMVNDNL